MWNYNLYKQFRSQHISTYWTIPMIQGYVGHSKINDVELILLTRRRWPMGGTRYNARGIDDAGNAANTVECEQIVLKHSRKDNSKRTLQHSFTQIRGSLPFFWTQDGSKSVKIDRSLDSSLEAFCKHTSSLLLDYDSDSLLMVNLLSQQSAHEELLTTAIRKILDETAPKFKQKEQRIDYDYFDFH